MLCYLQPYAIFALRLDVAVMVLGIDSNFSAFSFRFCFLLIHSIFFFFICFMELPGYRHPGTVDGATAPHKTEELTADETPAQNI